MRAAIYLRAASASPPLAGDEDAAPERSVNASFSPLRSNEDSSAHELSPTFFAEPKPAAGGALSLMFLAPRTVQRMLKDEAMLRQRLEISSLRALEHVFLDHLRSITAVISAVSDGSEKPNSPLQEDARKMKTKEMIEAEEAAARAETRKAAYRLDVLHHKIFLLGLEESSVRVQIQRGMEPARFQSIAKAMVHGRLVILLEEPRRKLLTQSFLRFGEIEEHESSERNALQKSISAEMPSLFPRHFVFVEELAARLLVARAAQHGLSELAMAFERELLNAAIRSAARDERSSRDEIVDEMGCAFASVSEQRFATDHLESAPLSVSAAFRQACGSYTSPAARGAQSRVIRQRQLEQQQKLRQQEAEEMEEAVAALLDDSSSQAQHGDDDYDATCRGLLMYENEQNCIMFDESRARESLEDDCCLATWMRTLSFLRGCVAAQETSHRREILRDEAERRCSEILQLAGSEGNESSSPCEMPSEELSKKSGGDFAAVTAEGHDVHEEEREKEENVATISFENDKEMTVVESLDARSEPLLGLVMELQRGIFSLRTQEASGRQDVSDHMATELDARRTFVEHEAINRDATIATEAGEALILALLLAEGVARLSNIGAAQESGWRNLLRIHVLHTERIAFLSAETAVRSLIIEQQEQNVRAQIDLLYSEDGRRCETFAHRWVVESLMLDEFRREDSERISISAQERSEFSGILVDEHFEAEHLARTAVDRQLKNEIAEAKKRRQQLQALLEGWQSKALDCERSGLHAEAVVNRRFCADLLAKTEGHKSFELAVARINLAKSLDAAGNLSEAHEQSLLALPILEAHMSGMTVDHAVLLNMIALQCKRLIQSSASSTVSASGIEPGTDSVASMQLELALSCLNRCIQVRSVLTPNTLELASIHSTLGNLYRAAGENEKAKLHLFACLEIQQQHVDEFNDSALLDLATSHSNLAVLFANSGDHPAAVVQMKRGLAIRDHLCPAAATTAAAYTVAASLLRKCDNHEEALAMLEHAIEIRKTSFGSNQDTTVETANILRSMAKTQLALRKPLDAQVSYTAAIKILEISAPNSLELTDSLYSIGKVSLAQDNLTAALQQFNHCLALQQKLGVEPADIQFTQKKIRAVFAAQKSADKAATGPNSSVRSVREKLTEAV
jgi:tetratricopeptide (TPR) repeat protein